MVGHSVFETLEKLQEVINRRMKVEQRLDNLAQGIERKKAIVSRLEERIEDAGAKLSAYQKELDVSEAELKEAETLRMEAEQKMGSITSQREYEIVEKEIRDISERELLARQQYRTVQREHENLAAQLERSTQLLESEKGEANSLSAGHDEARETEESELAQIIGDEDELKTSLDPELFFKFYRVVRGTGGLGITTLNNQTCSGCHMELPIEFANHVKKGEEIVFCPSCSRILHVEDTDTATQRGSFIGEIGGLAHVLEEEDLLE